jgi:hypothetical protein
MRLNGEPVALAWGVPGYGRVRFQLGDMDVELAPDDAHHLANMLIVAADDAAKK